jgi:non-heme chloroperoxidase
MSELSFTRGEAVADDGARLIYKTTGSGQNTVVFMHGWGSTKDYFDETLSCMSLLGLRVVCFDLRGHGDSPEGPDNYSSERMARDLLTVADAVGAETFVTIGHSMAAKFIQLLPTIAPDRVLGQVLVAGCPAGVIPIGDEVLNEFANYAGNRDAMRQSHHAIISRPIRHEVSEKWVAQAAAISRRVLYATLEACFRDDLAARVAALETVPPTLVVAAKHDPFFPLESMKRDVADKLPGSRLIAFDCGHEIPYELPTELAWALESFVAGCRSERTLIAA